MKKERGYYGKERIYKDVDTGFCHWYNYSYTYCGYEKYRGGISVKTVLKYTPENTCLTMAVLFCFLL